MAPGETHDVRACVPGRLDPGHDVALPGKLHRERQRGDPANRPDEVSNGRTERGRDRAGRRFAGVRRRDVQLQPAETGRLDLLRLSGGLLRVRHDEAGDDVRISFPGLLVEAGQEIDPRLECHGLQARAAEQRCLSPGRPPGERIPARVQQEILSGPELVLGRI